MTYETLSRFSFHKPDADGVVSMRQIRIEIRNLAATIEARCPASKEKATALTHLAIVMMHANSAIVQQYPIDPSDLDTEERFIWKDAMDKANP